MLISCKCRCRPDEFDVDVRDRADDEDIVDWMDDVVRPAVTMAHQKLSPLCTAVALEHVKIPIPENAPFIGGKPRLDS